MTLKVALLLLAALQHAASHLQPAVEFYERGEFQRAATALLKDVEAAPEAAELRLWLGKTYLKLQEWDESIEELRKAVELDPSNAVYHLWLGRAYGARASHSSIFTAFGWARRVVKEFETARMLAPENMDIRFDLLEFYLEAPGIVGGGRDKAEQQAKEISELNPRMGYRARGMLLEKQKKWEEARRIYVQESNEFKMVPEAWLDLANFLFSRSDFEGALTNARKALELRKPYPEAELVAGKALILLGTDPAAAEESLERLTAGRLGDDDPSFDDVFYWLGRAYLAQAKKSEARQALETALRFNPEHSEAKSALRRI